MPSADTYSSLAIPGSLRCVPRSPGGRAALLTDRPAVPRRVSTPVPPDLGLGEAVAGSRAISLGQGEASGLLLSRNASYSLPGVLVLQARVRPPPRALWDPDNVVRLDTTLDRVSYPRVYCRPTPLCLPWSCMPNPRCPLVRLLVYWLSEVGPIWFSIRPHRAFLMLVIEPNCFQGNSRVQ